MLLNETQLLKLKGWYVLDCVVRTKEVFHFSCRNLKESEDANILSECDVTKQDIGLYLYEQPQAMCESFTLTGFDDLLVGASSDPSTGLHEVVFVDTSGRVYAKGNAGHNGIEDDIPRGFNGPRRGAIWRIRMIHGRLYFVGSDHTVGYRKGPNDWQSLCLNLPMPKDKKQWMEEGSENFDFSDIDGFSHNDLYAVGGKSNLWHYNGQQWEKIKLPFRLNTDTICCGGDGFVYICAQPGRLYKGRGEQWELICRDEFILPLKDMVWHADKLWCTTDYGLWCVEDDKLVSMTIPAELIGCAGNLSTADGVMLMAGMYGAAWHEGKEWHLIFNSQELHNRT